MRLVYLIMIGLLFLLSTSLPNTSVHASLPTSASSQRTRGTIEFTRSSGIAASASSNATITFSAFGGSLEFNGTEVAYGWGTINRTFEYPLGNYSAYGRPLEFLSTFGLSLMAGISSQGCYICNSPRFINWTSTGGVNASAVSADPVNVTVTGNGTLSVHMTPLGPITPRVVLFAALLIPGIMILQKRRPKKLKGNRNIGYVSRNQQPQQFREVIISWP